MKITISLAGIPIELNTVYENYLPLYKQYICIENPTETVEMTEQEIFAAIKRYPELSTPAYVEHMETCPKTSNALLKHERAFFHGVAFAWRGKAWIITAPPETGKTTHYVLWKLLYGDEIQLINGDRPILECTDSGIVVHPSPWNGKENMGQMISAPLGGIVILEQADENRIERMGKEAILSIFKQFFYKVNRDSVKKVFEIEDKMLRSVPVFKLYNVGDRDSARMCHDALEEAMK